MNRFEIELEKGNFVVGECQNCKLLIWPPSDFCSRCFSSVKWRNASKIGKLIEFSKISNNFFCIVEFENKIRVIGSLKTGVTNPQIGQKVKLEKCGKFNGNYSFTLKLG